MKPDLLARGWMLFVERGERRRRGELGPPSSDVDTITPKFHNGMWRALGPHEFATWIKASPTTQLETLRKWLADKTGYERFETNEDVFDAMKMIETDELYEAFIAIFEQQ